MRQQRAEKENQNDDDQRRSQFRQSRRRCGPGCARCAEESLLEEGRQQEEGRAQGPEGRQGWQSKAAAPTKKAEAAKKAAKLARGKADRKPRAESKGAMILEMIGRAKGATLAET